MKRLSEKAQLQENLTETLYPIVELVAQPKEQVFENSTLKGDKTVKAKTSLLKIKSVAVVTLLLLSIAISGVVAYAQGPEPTDMVITKSTRIELVPQQTEDGEVLVPVTVHTIEMKETVQVPERVRPKPDGVPPNKTTSNVVVDGVTVTMSRRLEWYADPNNPDTFTWVRAGGRTQTSECVDAVKMDWIIYQYWEPGCSCWQNEKTATSWDLWGCKDDSGWANTQYVQYFNGNKHRAVGDRHRVTINGNDYDWYGEGPESVLP